MSTVVESEREVRPLAAGAGAHTERERRPRPFRLRVHSALRWLHIYTSMASLLVVLFFGATGITLNHPTWLGSESTEETTGHMPAAWRTNGAVDWLVVAEYLRAHGVRGAVTDRNGEGNEASLTFKAPGYSADCFIDSATGDYRLTVSYQGAVGVLNDLHRGRDAGAAWNWLIDVSGGFLTLVAITGLGLLVYLKKIRARALMTMAIGAVGVTLIAMFVM